MRIVSPLASENSASRTMTFTERLKEFRPSADGLVDAGFLLLLSLTAFYGFGTLFDTPQYLLVAALGLALGILTAHLALVLRWHWLLVILLVIVEFFLLGAMLSAQEETIGGFVPTIAGLASLGQLVIGGWKDLLTTLPPLPGDGPFIALPYLMGLVSGGIGFWVARRSRRAGPALITPVVLAVMVILLGTLQPAPVMTVGVAMAVTAFVWLTVRTRRQRRLVGTGRSHRASLIAGGLLVALAAGLGAVTAGFLPGAETTRFVLRTYVQPPVETKDLASPLAGFRKYSSKTLNRGWGSELMKVDGAPAGSLLRIAVLDDYTDHTWSASGGTSTSSGFQRVGSRVPYAGGGTPVHLTVTFSNGYAQSSELGGWLPSMGDLTGVEFAGANTKTHRSTFRYDIETAQGLLAGGDRFHPGDVVTVDTVVLPQGLDLQESPGGDSPLDPSSYSFLSSVGQQWADSASTPGERIAAIAAHLKAGYWSDGTLTGETQYLPGHSKGRLSTFVAHVPLVGSDEQYASTFALLCNQSGFPARVVFGAVVPQGGVVQGQDIRAWVELQTEQGWRAVPPNAFTPDTTRHPPKVPLTVSEQRYATNVPPPNPTRLSLGSLGLSDSDLSTQNGSSGWLATLLKWAMAVLQVIGVPLAILIAFLGGVTAAKATRRRRRRTSGTASKRVAAAWAEIVDQCRDLGILLSSDATRLEQSWLVGDQAVSDLADRANTATFGPDQPSADDLAALWTGVRVTRKHLLQAASRGKRFVARFNVRSLLPERLATLPLPSLPRPSFRRPTWLRLPGRPTPKRPVVS